jgi:hypothetical protein
MNPQRVADGDGAVPALAQPRANLGQPVEHRSTKASSALPVCLLVWFVALGVVWALARPYGVTTDEEAHYARALGAGIGDLSGQRVKPPDGPLNAQERTLTGASRRFREPADVAPRPAPAGGSIFSCFAFAQKESASCITKPTGPVLNETYVGVYPPVAYVVPGLAARMAGEPVWGLLFARLGSGIVCLLVLAFCVFALHDPAAPALSLFGVTVALTPTVLFFAWSMNANGLEMVAGIAFVALCLRLGRDEAPPTLVWTATAVAGFLLATCRPLSFVWVFFGLWVVAVVHGPSRVIRNARRAGRPAVVLVVVLSTAVVAVIVWNLAVKPRAPGGAAALSELVGPAVRQVRLFLAEQIGLFGWAEFHLPWRMYSIWEVLFVAMAAMALVVGTWRQRLAPFILFATYIAGDVALTKLSQGGGFPMAGRYIFPGFAALPLVWSEVILLNRHRLPSWLRRGFVLTFVTVVAGTHAAALLINGRRYAVGTDGPWSYLFGGDEWAPPGGWFPWVALVAVAVAFILAGFVGASRRGDRTPKPRRPIAAGQVV